MKPTSKIYRELVKEHQTCNLPQKEVNIDWNSLQFLDADMADLNKPKRTRFIFFIANEIKTNTKIILAEPFAKRNDKANKVIDKLLGELMKIGYRWNKAKTLTAFTLDLHNPKIDTLNLKLKTKLV